MSESFYRDLRFLLLLLLRRTVLFSKDFRMRCNLGFDRLR